MFFAVIKEFLDIERLKVPSKVASYPCSPNMRNHLKSQFNAKVDCTWELSSEEEEEVFDTECLPKTVNEFRKIVDQIFAIMENVHKYREVNRTANVTNLEYEAKIVTETVVHPTAEVEIVAIEHTPKIMAHSQFTYCPYKPKNFDITSNSESVFMKLGSFKSGTGNPKNFDITSMLEFIQMEFESLTRADSPVKEPVVRANLKEGNDTLDYFNSD